MKKMTLVISTFVCLFAVSAFVATQLNFTTKQLSIMKNVESLTACEASLNGKIVFQCDGENGTCSGSYTKFGQEVAMSCSGKKVEN